METNMNFLKGKIIEKGYTQETFAKAIGMNDSTLSRRLKSSGSFTIEEVNKIINELGLTGSEALAIFFASLVA